VSGYAELADFSGGAEKRGVFNAASGDSNLTVEVTGCRMAKDAI
jgi:hypothetical protein